MITPRRNPRQMLRALCMLALLLPIIAACGGAPATQEATSAPAAPTSAPAATAAPAPTSAPEATAAPAAAVPDGTVEAGTPGGTLTGAWVGPCCVGVDNLNPLSAGGDYHFLNKIYSHLVTYDVTYTKIVSDLADSWSISDDNLTWTFKLHPNVKWHDGSAFTADDVAFALELCIDPNAGGCDRGSQLTAIKGAKEYAAGTAK